MDKRSGYRMVAALYISYGEKLLQIAVFGDDSLHIVRGNFGKYIALDHDHSEQKE